MTDDKITLQDWLSYLECEHASAVSILGIINQRLLVSISLFVGSVIACSQDFPMWMLGLIGIAVSLFWMWFFQKEWMNCNEWKVCVTMVQQGILSGDLKKTDEIVAQLKNRRNFNQIVEIYTKVQAQKQNK